VCRLGQDLCAFIGEVLEDNELGFRFAVQDTGRAFIPISTFFPSRPCPLGIKAVQLIGAAAYIWIEGEQGRISFFFEDVLGEETGAALAVKEGGVEA